MSSAEFRSHRCRILGVIGAKPPPIHCILLTELSSWVASPICIDRKRKRTDKIRKQSTECRTQNWVASINNGRRGAKSTYKHVKEVVKIILETVTGWYQQYETAIMTPALCFANQNIWKHTATPSMLVVKQDLIKTFAYHFAFYQNHGRIYHIPFRLLLCGGPRFKEFIPSAWSFLAFTPVERLLEPP